MLSLIEALNYHCLRDVRQDLGPFHVLVGPNASGKSTFLDVVAFLGRLVSDGLEAALHERSKNIEDLFWNRTGSKFELAIEAKIPEHLRKVLSKSSFETIRYEVVVGLDAESGETSLIWEKVLLSSLPSEIKRSPAQIELFPMSSSPRQTLTTPSGTRGTKVIVNKTKGGNDNYYSETTKKWNPSFKLGPQKSALGNLPEGESRFPVSTWFKNLLAEGVQPFVLNSRLMRQASPPGQGWKLKPDGSNLPWVIARLKEKARQRFDDWLAHLRTALGDIKDIQIITREDDKHSYLNILYSSGLQAPSWVASDGTLRLLALTLSVYLPDVSGIFLIEEPENGIHPRAVETVFQSLSSFYDAQVLLATHSPVVLSIALPEQVLCFGKTEEGATDIILGSDHPNLRNWRGETNLGVLFAAGVLG